MDFFYPNIQKFSRDSITQKTAALLLGEHLTLKGYGFGAKTEKIGELCFNTSISGYQEILTDPSYAGQMVCFTFPHIGNVGTNNDDCEARTSFINGCVVKAKPTTPANYRAIDHLHQWLERRGIPGIYGVDTRMITHYLRDNGASNCMLIHHHPHQELDIDYYRKKLKIFSGLEGLDLAKDVTCESAYDWYPNDSQLCGSHGGIWNMDDNTYDIIKNDCGKIAVIDFGVKNNILRSLAQRGSMLRIFPATSSYEDVIAWQPDGIFLSNGPGDPQATGHYAVPMIQKFLQTDLPIFGICLGHQMLALALGAKTIKMAFGHHGANHPIFDYDRKQVLITSQNHGFNVSDEGLDDNIIVTHRSLFDKSLAGLRLKDRPVFSIQYHPEASPGPQDSNYLFDQFISHIQKSK